MTSNIPLITWQNSGGGSNRNFMVANGYSNPGVLSLAISGSAGGAATTILSEWTSTGLAVTGALSATGQLTVTGAAQNPFGSTFTPTAWGTSSVDINHASGGMLAVYYGGTAKGYFVANSGTAAISLNTQGDGTINQNVNGTTRASVTSAGLAVTGQVAATTTAGQHTFNVTQSITTGYAGVNILRAGTGQQAIRFAQATDGNEVGSITVSTTATAYNTSSDYRLKNITGPLTDSGTFIDTLKPKAGTWKVDGSKFVGFIAHEFAEVSPSSVSGEKDAVDEDGKPKYQSMQASTAEVIANLVAELQSVRQRLAALETK